MSLFSQRMGLRPVTVNIQNHSMSDELRNGLWDALYLTFLKNPGRDHYTGSTGDQNTKEFVLSLWHNFFKIPTDTVPDFWPHTLEYIRKRFFGCDWSGVYDLIEFTAKNHEKTESLDAFVKLCNRVMERENSAYRFVGKNIVEITSPLEIGEVETGLRAPFQSTRTHIATALTLLSDREKPDYRNSIKESVSAVEATCIQILGVSKTLGQALNELEKKGIVSFHGAEKEAFSKLYGWTSDGDGIRHALMDEPNLDYDDAKFMLVACSAFCNYLISKSKDKRPL